MHSARGNHRVFNPHRSSFISWLLILAMMCQFVILPETYASGRGALPIGEQPSANSTQVTQGGETFTIFGPRRFDSTGPLTRTAESFPLPTDAVGPYTIQVQNGDLDGSNRVLTGTVSLNGAALLGWSDLNLSVPSVSRPVTLAASNTLEVHFLSRRSAYLVITVTAAEGTPSTKPVIANFTPKRGPAGTVVVLTGKLLTVDTGTTTVTFAGPDNSRLPAPVFSATQTEAHMTVPDNAVTGFIELTNARGTATTNGVFTVESPQDFNLTVSPSAATAVQRGTATYVGTVTSQQTTFTQLARLSATGLPAGVIVMFEPAQVTAGAASTLSVNLNNVELAPGSYPFIVRAAASVEGRELVRTAPATLNVLAAGQTTLSGRVLSTEKEPIIGATASLDGKTATTDAAGTFLLTGVTPGVNRPVMIDGRTASAPGRTYPVITEPATVVVNQANVVPFTFYLPPIDTQYEVPLIPNQNTVSTNPRVPSLQMTVPVGANLRNLDGTPVARVSITPLAPDRTPAPLPPNVTAALVYTSQPGGAIADIAMPVVYPNLTGANPGTQMELYAFNHQTVQWYVYGYGRVSADGRTIAPITDPTTGRPYGLKDFSWHAPSPPAPPTPDNPSPGPTPDTNSTPNPNPTPSSCRTGGASSPWTPLPVDLSTGLKMEKATDISFNGARGGIELTRSYTTGLAVNNFNGRFGRGTKDNYDIRLNGTFQAGGAGRLVMPGEGGGRLFSYARTDADGALVFTSTATVGQLGDVVRKLSSGTFEYRYADGRVLRFDSAGRLTATVDRNSNTTTLEYTGLNLTRVTDPVGRQIVLDYDTGNRITRAADPLGRIWQYSYDGNGRLSKVTDPLFNDTQYSYDGFSRLVSVTDPRGAIVKQLTYDNGGRVSEQRFADGGVESYNYALDGTIVTETIVTDKLGRQKTKRFSGTGYVIGHIDALGQGAEIERDLVTNLPTLTTGPCGCPEVAREFDNRGNLTKVTDRLGQVTRYEYDPVFNHVTKMTDPLGRVTTFGYDTRGNFTSVTDALNQTTQYTYDDKGQLTAVTDPLNHTSQVEYDAAGNVTARVDALGNRTTMEYDGIGRLTATIDPLDRRTEMEYDALGRIVSVTDPANAKTVFAYDANGNQVGVINALGRKWTRIYDHKNRLRSATDPLGNVTRYKYNSDDEMVAVTSPSGRVTRYTYDPRGQPETVTDPLNGVVKYTYDNRGNLATLTDQRNNTTTFTYDELFRQKERRDPLGLVSSVGYDAAGNVTLRTDRLGRQTVVEHDAINRPKRITYADAVVTYTYDAAGRRTRVDDTQGGQIEWSYDDADKLLSETTPAGTLSYLYNKVGQRISMTVADRPPVTYGYDSAGRLQTITQGTETFTYSYDTLSRMSGLVRPNNVKTTHNYDMANRLERLTHTNGLNQIIEDLQYSYNPDDQIASIASLASAQMLPEAKTISPADAANRIAQFGQPSYSFNDEGQTAIETDDQGTTIYEWDARGRLTRATLPSGQTVSYGYDALGRRANRTAGGVTMDFLYDRADVVLDRGSNGSQTDYLNGLGIDQKLRQANAITGSLYFLPDHLGSTMALTEAVGNVVEQMSYEAFGENSGSMLTRYGYTGRERDSMTGSHYYRARWYDPWQGRFISEDPIDYVGGMNLYRYVSDDPINFTDPEGLFECYWTCKKVIYAVACAWVLVCTGKVVKPWPTPPERPPYEQPQPGPKPPPPGNGGEGGADPPDEGDGPTETGNEGEAKCSPLQPRPGQDSPFPWRPMPRPFRPF